MFSHMARRVNTLYITDETIAAVCVMLEHNMILRTCCCHVVSWIAGTVISGLIGLPPLQVFTHSLCFQIFRSSVTYIQSSTDSCTLSRCFVVTLSRNHVVSWANIVTSSQFFPTVVTIAPTLGIKTPRHQHGCLYCKTDDGQPAQLSQR